MQFLGQFADKTQPHEKTRHVQVQFVEDRKEIYQDESKIKWIPLKNQFHDLV
jgi:hypothetical protein